MKIKKLLVGVVASVLVVASVATTAFAAQSPSTDKTPTPTPKPAATSSSGSSTSTKTQDINPDVLASNISGDDIKTITRYYADPAQPNIGAVRIIDLL